MNINRFTVVIITVVVFCSCHQKSKTPDTHSVTKDSIVFSFAFMGCNRVDHSDRHRSDPVYHSTANAYALSRIFEDMTDQKNHPDG